MSDMNSSQSEQAALENVNFTGGFPTSKDFAPSIIFLTLYLLTLPVLVWRMSRRSDRTTILIRPCIFLVARIGMLVVRAIQSRREFVLDLMIAELVMVSVGFLFLIDPVIELWRRHIASCLPTHQQPGWVKKVAVILKIGLLAAIGTGVAGAAQVSSAFNSESGIETVKNLRKVSYILSLVVVAVTIFAIISTHLSFGLDTRKTGYNLLAAIPLLVVAIYRVAQCLSTNSNSAARSLTAFWILMVLFEFIAYIFLLAISLPAWYPAVKKVKDGDMEMGPPKY